MECHLQIFLAGCWRDCAVLTVPNPSRGGINLETCMQEAGVDADIITHLQLGIVEQVRQLRTLETG